MGTDCSAAECSGRSQRASRVGSTASQEISTQGLKVEVYNRKDKSLSMSSRSFIDLMQDKCGEEISLDAAALQIGVERRRVYDIVNVFESIGAVERRGRSRYIWLGTSKLVDSLESLSLTTVEATDAAFESSPDTTACSDATATSTGTVPSLTGEPNSQKDVPDAEPAAAQATSAADRRKEGSLAILCTKFVRVLIHACPDPISLCEAAIKLAEGDEEARTSPAKLKTKIRRLYDIANILSSVGLVEKVNLVDKNALLGGKKPGFRWLGPRHAPQRGAKGTANGAVHSRPKKRPLPAAEARNSEWAWKRHCDREPVRRCSGYATPLKGSSSPESTSTPELAPRTSSGAPATPVSEATKSEAGCHNTGPQEPPPSWFAQWHQQWNLWMFTAMQAMETQSQLSSLASCSPLGGPLPYPGFPMAPMPGMPFGLPSSGMPPHPLAMNAAPWADHQNPFTKPTSQERGDGGRDDPSSGPSVGCAYKGGPGTADGIRAAAQRMTFPMVLPVPVPVQAPRDLDSEEFGNARQRSSPSASELSAAAAVVSLATGSID